MVSGVLDSEVETEVVVESLGVPSKRVGHLYIVPVEWLDVAIEKGTEAANEFWKTRNH
jgi:hypothetical protein